MGGFEDRVVLITGTRLGIGRYLAEHFCQRGARVIGMNRQPAPMDLDGYDYLEADVSDERAVIRAVHTVRERHGQLDVLVNNAGVAGMNHVLTTPASALERILRTNVVGTFLMSREAAKVMRRRRFGRIVNVSSVAHSMRLEGEAAYAASKAAVESLTGVMARELADFGITCNAVRPPPVPTALIAGVPAEKIEAIVGRLAIKRLGTFADVANVVDFLAREESSFVTGEVIGLGGS